MKNCALILLTAIILSCSTSNNESEYVYTSETLKIESLTGNVFTHISYLTTDDFGKVECNGMVYLNGDEAIVFDTPTNDESSAELINWILKEQGKTIKAIVVTHFHNDCLGGLSAFHTNGVQSYASSKTIELAKSNNMEALPEVGFDDRFTFQIGSEPVHARFYGAGHTVDNMVGYIPNEKILFGGCLIKSMNASKGFLGDAAPAEWSTTVEAIKMDLPDVKIIIPGHGKHGGRELLDYTIQLFRD